jgi:hypothetical protein
LFRTNARQPLGCRQAAPHIKEREEFLTAKSKKSKKGREEREEREEGGRRRKKEEEGRRREIRRIIKPQRTQRKARADIYLDTQSPASLAQPPFPPVLLIRLLRLRGFSIFIFS